MKYIYHISAQRSIILFFLLKLSVACFAQPENKIATADKSIQQLLEWRIVGPFKDTLKNIRDLGSLKLNAQDTGQRMIDTIYRQDKDNIDFEALFKTNANRIGYAICKVFSDKDQEMVFFIQADDVMRFWINDSEAFKIPGWTRYEAVVRKGYLKKGVNVLIAEINNTGGGNWGFDIDVTTKTNAQNLTAAFLSVIPKNSINEVQRSKVQLKNWKIIGPFSNTLGNIDMDQLGYLRFIPENARRTTLDTMYQQGKDGVDLSILFGTEMRGIAYAVCDVVSEEDQDLAFLVNVDDEMRLWKNNSQVLSVTGYTGGGAVIKKVNVKKGVSRLIAEIRNTGGGTWWFDITPCGFEYIRNNALLPDFYVSSQKFIIPEGDHLSLRVSDTDFVPVKNISTVKIFDARNKNCYTGQIDIKKDKKFALPKLSPGAYRYELYTDRDTLNDYFCYGSIDKIYNKENLAQEYKYTKTVYDALLPYMKRLDRLLGDYNKAPNINLSKKIAYCIYKVKEIDSAYRHRSLADLNSTGLSLRMFTSAIEHGEEHYLLYVPEKIKKQHSPVPLTVIVPYVTNYHPFYTGGIIANTDRITYISKFAERYGMAVLWPSSRIFKWYNQTPIVTKSIIESIEDVCKHYNIDKKHIFLYGECSGGLFAFQTAIRRPDLFAAIGIEGPELKSVNTDETEISGMLTNNLFNLTENLYGKPLLILHSANDQKAPVDHSLRLMDSIKNTGGSVYYDDLNNVLRATYAKLYSESESMSKIFTFFNTQKESRPDSVKKIATYGFYNDTVYGVLVKEKIVPGKATVSYQIKNNRLELTAINVRKLMIDTRKMDFEGLKNIAIDFNGKRLAKGIDYKTRGPIIELKNNNASEGKGNYFTKEVHGPMNKVFLNNFAIVRPAQANEKVKLVIAIIDSLWADEYRNHVLIIDEKQVDSAKR
jgi:predicted esterase